MIVFRGKALKFCPSEENEDLVLPEADKSHRILPGGLHCRKLPPMFTFKRKILKAKGKILPIFNDRFHPWRSHLSNLAQKNPLQLKRGSRFFEVIIIILN